MFSPNATLGYEGYPSVRKLLTVSIFCSNNGINVSERLFSTILTKKFFSSVSSIPPTSYVDLGTSSLKLLGFVIKLPRTITVSSTITTILLPPIREKFSLFIFLLFLIIFFKFYKQVLTNVYKSYYLCVFHIYNITISQKQDFM